jgi:DNA (cytosine-5)-methyltransferase 1
LENPIKILNLYAGLGGNRLKWHSHQITAVESDKKIAAVYANLFPYDTVLVTDAHDYLLQNHADFDFIWSSPPCQSHSRMIRSGQHRKPTYPDLRLYEQILFLKNSKDVRNWVVENVIPWYTPLVEPAARIGRHLFWSNLDLTSVQDKKSPPGFIKRQNQQAKAQLEEWLGFPSLPNIYYNGNHDPTQILRNCIHPDIGREILNRVDN